MQSMCFGSIPLQRLCTQLQAVTRLVQNAADAENDEDEEEDDVPVKPSLSRPGKRGGKATGAVSAVLTLHQ